MANLPVVGPGYKEDSLVLNAQDCVNLFVTSDSANPARPEGRGASLQSMPGAGPLVDTAQAECRGMISDDNFIYAVYGDTFYEFAITTQPLAAVATDRGTLTSSSLGNLSMAQSFSHVMVTDGVKGWSYQKSNNTFAEIVDADYNDTASEVAYAGGYFFTPKADSDTIYASGLTDPTSWDALDFTTAERFGDKVTALAVVRGELWALGSESTQIYASSASAIAFPFDLVEGVDLKVGCNQPKSVLNIDDNLFWLDNRGFVVRANGYDVRVISTPAISSAIQNYDDRTCVAYSLIHNGYRFYCLSFNNEATTWTYNLDTEFWQELRSTFDDEFLNGVQSENDQHRHIINHSALHKGMQFGGSWANGKLYHVSDDYRLDDDQPIIRQRTTAHFFNEFKKIHVGKIELQLETGSAEDTGQASDPKIMMQYSKDRGRTWSNELWRSTGKVGEYSKRVRWHRLGMAHNWTFRFRMSDPVKVTIVEASWEGK